MAEKQLENEVLEIFQYIRNGENFLLSGGAGSGKTYSLVHVIKKAIEENPTAKIACMTYTNAAVKEIEERVNHTNLIVSTIHDFLWNSIKSFQRDLKKSLISLINHEHSKILSPDGIVNNEYFDLLEKGIQYKEYTQINKGIISHDEIIELANYMFKNYPLLCDILKDRFNFIFIDEYQDSNPMVVEIFLEHLKQSEKKNVIGFFGDSMQSIYDEGIGDLNKYIDCGDVKEVQKKQNRRNPRLVMNLANRLRTDGIVQEPPSEGNAPNMCNGTIKEGNIKFLYSSKDNIEEIKNSSYFEDWDFKDSKQTKELYLTHNLIAPKAGFPELMAIYDKDPIIDLKNKIRTKIKKDNLVIDENYTFDQVVDLVALTNKKRLRKDILNEDPINAALYEQLKDLPFLIVSKIYLTKDSLIDDKKQDENDENKQTSKRDSLIKHLFKIQSIIQLYKDKSYNEFIRKTEFQIISIEKKREINNIIKKIEGISDLTIEEVIDYADEVNICKKDDSFHRFLKENEYVYNRVKKVNYQEFQNLFAYLEGYTPYSTQHKIKGAEFNNVFVVLDNGKWSDFNFGYLLDCTSKMNESVLKRTQKMFYVCCTRAKNNLIVFYHDPSPAVISRAKDWFGDENVHII